MYTSAHVLATINDFLKNTIPLRVVVSATTMQHCLLRSMIISNGYLRHLQKHKHEFHETCHSVTFIVVLVNSHLRWKHCGVTASFGVFFHEIKCNGMTSFMEFMSYGFIMTNDKLLAINWITVYNQFQNAWLWMSVIKK